MFFGEELNRGVGFLFRGSRNQKRPAGPAIVKQNGLAACRLEVLGPSDSPPGEDRPGVPIDLRSKLVLLPLFSAV